ncbi:MAG: hypothetical protein ACR2HX_19395 [Pyrinomonadaceae bacterium]
MANQFFSVRRSGAETVDAILQAVKADALRRVLTEEGEGLATQKKLLALLGTEEARVYAKAIIDREALPKEKKRLLKTERSEHYRREYMKVQPPTEPQIRLLRSLGCVTIPVNRLQASELIEQHK